MIQNGIGRFIYGAACPSIWTIAPMTEISIPPRCYHVQWPGIALTLTPDRMLDSGGRWSNFLMN